MRLALITAALVILLGKGEGALACAGFGPPLTEDQLFLRASAVFIARVVRIEEKSFKGRSRPTVKSEMRTWTRETAVSALVPAGTFSFLFMKVRKTLWRRVRARSG